MLNILKNKSIWKNDAFDERFIRPLFNVSSELTLSIRYYLSNVDI